MVLCERTVEGFPCVVKIIFLDEKRHSCIAIPAQRLFLNTKARYEWLGSPERNAPVTHHLPVVC